MIAVFEEHPNIPFEQLDAVQSVYKDMLDGKVQIVTSTLYHTEVFRDPGSDEARSIKEELEGCPYFEILLPSVRTYELTGDLRRACDAAGRKIKGLDATHIATGQQARVEAIWTTDVALVSKYEAGLLGNVKVMLPSVPQYRLGI